MLIENLKKHESDFLGTGVGLKRRQFNLDPFSLEIQDGSGDFANFIKCRPADGDKSYYFDEKVDKDQIVLHFTAGYLKGDLAQLTKKNNRVSVPFLLPREGGILNIMPSTRWSYHLGPGALGGNSAGSRRTIGIELSNIGPLIRVGDFLCSTYKNKDGEYKDRYCHMDQKEFYHEVPNFRGYKFFASYTDCQYEDLVLLLRYLCARNDIPKRLLPEVLRYETTESVLDFNGITSHINYRTNGKWDIGPAFNWEYLLEHLT